MKTQIAHVFAKLSSFMLRMINPIMFKTLSSDIERQRYNSLYIEKTGASVPIEYQKQGHAYIFYHYNTPEKWLGGFILNCIADFRYLSAFEPYFCQRMLNRFNISTQDLCEIGCLWMHSRRSFEERLYVYSALLIKAYQTGKGVLLAGSYQPSLADLQRKVFRTTIFHDSITIQGKQGVLEMYIVKRSDLIWNGLESIIRAIFSKKKVKQKKQIKKLILTETLQKAA